MSAQGIPLERTQGEQTDRRSAARPASPADDCYLPDFCNPRMALAVVLIAELLAIVVTLARRSAAGDFWIDLAASSMFLLWTALTAAALLCVARPRLVGARASMITLVAALILVLTTALVSEATFWLGRYFEHLLGSRSEVFPSERLGFVARNIGISAIVSVLILRYFYVAHQWKRNVEMEAHSRVSALQARIRPHFLFNSMNTIASLTRSRPETAEQAVEDLADLFRASLSDARQQIRLKEEFEMARIYQRIEQLRLGERLEVDWRVDALPMRAFIPALTVQPLLENAIYHGIEPLPEGGTVSIDGARDGDSLEIRVSNPLPQDTQGRAHQGNQMALSNIEQRLKLAYGDRAKVAIDSGPERFQVTLRFPCRE